MPGLFIPLRVRTFDGEEPWRSLTVKPEPEPPISPMLAKLVRELPEGPFIYEPKWDGFRALVFKRGEEVVISSRNTRPLTRYFPELVPPLLASLPARCVLDGEIVIVSGKGLDFDALLQRVHPAESRIRKLAAQTPASFVAFDLLELANEDLRPAPFAQRRQLLEALFVQVPPPLYVTPATDSLEVARHWFRSFEGAGLDGVMAKAMTLPYVAGKREMFKVKHERTADCVVGGFRTHKDGRGVGSLLLGLFTAEGQLNHVGVATGFSVKERAKLLETLEPLRQGALEGHPWEGWALEKEQAEGRMPGARSRWNAQKNLSWEPLRPERVVEVAYDHLQRDRFRHATRFVRFRPDREPRSCTYEQLEVPVPYELSRVFGALG